jgi:hypothetical protein
LAKTKWKGLRDNFRKELQKIKKPMLKDSVPPPMPRWVHYKALQFLRDVMQPRKISRNRPVTSMCNKEYELPEGTNEEIMSEGESQKHEAASSDDDASKILDPEPATTSCQPGKHSRAPKHRTAKSTLNYQQEMLRLEEKKMERIFKQQDDNNDDDLNFFRSLVPYMKMLPPYKKLCLRSQFQNMLANEISTNENNSLHPSASSSNLKPQTVLKTIHSHMI